ncbi:hypothetical protein BV25DRAFT_1817752 [Artomyces pyxidatus]|uniref:Uncharacterized protein n=1 Tax=Artomyces pyxidatus TaxID=48021 RepID=A0ACB8TK80_9AGAM|nr:hypothetical protein BV25DRAFT_1817752 [Artomyces pyxidatus]
MSSRSPSPSDSPPHYPGELPVIASPPRSPSPGAVREARLAALQRRQATLPPEESTESFKAFDDDYAKRIEFRRLIEPGILRPNAKEVAMASIRTLSTIAENLLREPENPKFRQFKPTNHIIKQRLVDPKGALEYAVALGFRPEVENFQPLYVFHDRHMSDLRIGAAILLEVMAVEAEKQERDELNKKSRKAEEDARVEKVKQAFIDDRRSKMMRDERERARAEAKKNKPA